MKTIKTVSRNGCHHRFYEKNIVKCIRRYHISFWRRSLAAKRSRRVRLNEFCLKTPTIKIIVGYSREDHIIQNIKQTASYYDRKIHWWEVSNRCGN